MADLALTATQISPVNETQPVITTMVAAAAITRGQVVYENTSGKADLARANATGTAQNIRGIALQDAAAGRPVNVLEKGSCYGFTLSGNPGDPIYVSTAVAGALATTATGTGNFVAPVGTVRAIFEGPSGANTVKVLYVNVPTSHAPYVAL